MIVTVFLLLIIILVIAFGYDYYVHHSRSGRLINKIPGLKTVPIFDNILTVQTLPKELWWLLRNITDQYYPITRFWSCFPPIVSIRHPDDLEVILNNTKHIEKSIIYDVVRPWLNDGLLTSTGAKWHSRRRILTSTFHFNILQQFVSILTEGERMTQKLKTTGKTIEMDLLSFVSEHTLNAICGQRFALLEMKAVIAPLVRNFYLEPIDYLKNLRIIPNLILRPNHSLNIRFVPIEVA